LTDEIQKTQSFGEAMSCLSKHCQTGTFGILVRGNPLKPLPKKMKEKVEIMNRQYEIKVRFNFDEIQSLNNNVKRTGMSRERYVRTLCNNKIPVEIPPADYYALIREVRALGNIMNQIAYKAHSMGLLDVPMYREKADYVIAVADILTAVCLPQNDS
jgi:hypothetical protein